MNEQPTPAQTARWHRRFAVECNNGAWDLMSKPQRTPDEDRDLLNMAYAAAFHWSQVGTPLNAARADVTLAHAHALLGQGDMALLYARRCLAWFESNPCEDWDLAFAHAEMAHAAAMLRDAPLHAKHYAEAQSRGAAIQNDEDRRAFLDELARIPAAV